MIILGIETSCDETALALIETKGSTAPAGRDTSPGEACQRPNLSGSCSLATDSMSSVRFGRGCVPFCGGTTELDDFQCRIIQSLVHSQAELHSAYGGVFPSLAKREHGKNLTPLLEKVLKDFECGAEISESRFKSALESMRTEIEPKNPDLYQSISRADFLRKIPKIDAIAVTEGPGLEPTLWVGINFARILGALWHVPIIPVNHMEGHILGSLLESDAPYGTWHKIKNAQMPAVALLISGGHTELVKVNSICDYKILGQTLDDAVGEAFDKVARLLGLPYPGGPHISRLAHEAYEAKISSPVKLPRPMIKSGNLNFSFSGLKTAVLYAVKKAEERGQFNEAYKKGLAYEFEQAVAEVLDSKLRRAITDSGARSIIVGGGVSANHVLRQKFEKTANELGIPIFLPSRHVSGDNALMIAWAGALNGVGEPRTLRAEGTKKLEAR